MTTGSIEQTSIDIIAVEAHADTALPENRTLPANDMRKLGLGHSGRLLGMQVGDLGPVGVRRAKDDLVHCPICPGH
jgi:hypothetical protein